MKGREADLVITGAVVIDRPSKDFEFSDAPAGVAVRQGRIVAIGSDGDVERWIGDATDVRRLAGHVVTPGLFDSHNHMLNTAVGARLASLEDVTDIAGLLRVVKTVRSEQGPGEWIECSKRWHESQFAEARMPSIGELDSAVPDAPVFLRRGGHNAVLNTEAFRRLGILDSTDNPPGATIVRDERGRPTGHVIGALFINRLALELPVLSDADKASALQGLGQRYLRAGITSIIEPGLRESDLRVFQALSERGDLPVRVHAMWRVGYEGEPVGDVVGAITRGQVTPVAGERFSVFGIKVSMDGGAETGYYREPYTHPDDSSAPYGKPLLSVEELTEIGLAAARRGWHVGVHCVGDAAIDDVLTAFGAVDRSIALAGRRWSLIHMMNARADHWAEVRRLGLTVTAQQPLVYALGEGFVHYIGEERAARLVPLSTFLAESPLPVGGGSDSPVSPFDPWIGLASSVTRRISSGRVLGYEHRIPPMSGLEMYTRGSAYCAFQEANVGRLAVGMAADLLVLEPGSFQSDDITVREPLVTMVDGQVHHDVL